MSAEQWKLQSYTYYTVTCSECHWSPTEQTQSPEQAIEQWMSWGWRLGATGPVCPYCDVDTKSLPSPTQAVKEMPAFEQFAQASQQLLSFEEVPSD